MTVIPAELQYVEVIAVTANSGYDANTGEELEEGADRELPGTVTLLVTPEQSKVLAELEADGKLHLSLVYRGMRQVRDSLSRHRNRCWKNCMLQRRQKERSHKKQSRQNLQKKKQMRPLWKKPRKVGWNKP